VRVVKNEGVYLIYGQVSDACLSMLRKFVGHCLTYGQGKGVKFGVMRVLCYSMFFARVQATEKLPKSNRKDYRKASNP
jgi:hypothetical protein